jgi:glucokinase
VIIDRAVAGEEEAGRVLTEGGVVLGRGLAGLVTMLDPEVVLLGGGIAEAGSIWWQAVESTLRDELIDVMHAIPLRRPRLGASAAILGAVHAAMTAQGMTSDPRPTPTPTPISAGFEHA